MDYKRRTLILLAILIFIGTALAFIRQRETGKNESDDIQHQEEANRAFHTQIKRLSLLTDRLITQIDAEQFSEWRFAAVLEKEQLPDYFSLHVYENDSLLYWSNVGAVPDSLALHTGKSNGFTQRNDGWYYFIKKSVGSKTLISAMRVYQQYPFENLYLQNRFEPYLSLSEHATLAESNDKGSFSVTDNSGFAVFKVRSGEIPADGFSNSLLHILWGLFLFVFFLAAMQLIRRAPLLPSSILLLAVIAVRISMIRLGIPGGLYEAPLFNSMYFASGFLLNSLGEFLITAGMFLMIAVYLQRLSASPGSFKNKGSRIIILSGFLFCHFAFSAVLHSALNGLVLNSQISFDINNIFLLGPFTLAGVISIGLLLLSFGFTGDAAGRVLVSSDLKKSIRISLYFIFQIVFAGLIFLNIENDVFHHYDLSIFLLANFLILFSGYLKLKGKSYVAASAIFPILLFMSIYTGEEIFRLNDQREKEKRKLLALRIENERDQVAEYLLLNNIKKIREDRELQNFLTNTSKQLSESSESISDLSLYLRKSFFSGYLNRYETEFKFFDSNEVPVNRYGDPSWNLESIKSDFNKEGIVPGDDDIRHSRDESGRSLYRGIIPISIKGKAYGTLVFEMRSRGAEDERGLPALLLSDRINSGKLSGGYTFARYVQGRLVAQQGDYNYYQTDAPYRYTASPDDNMIFVESEGRSHLYYRSAGQLIVISYPDKGFGEWLTLFSYLFTFFSVSILFVHFIRNLFQNNFHFKFGYRERIQTGIIFMVSFTLVLIGAATIASFTKNYRELQVQRVREQLENIRLLTERISYGVSSIRAGGNDNLSYALETLASSLKLDFNLFTNEGELFYTTQPGFFEQGIRAPLMNPVAKKALTLQQQSVFEQNENIGSLQFYSAYKPVKNNQGKIIGFINIPYFERDTELKQDISTFLAALINLYVLLFCIAVLIAFIISNRITAPLQLLQETLRKTSLSQHKEPLQWKSEDEFGTLVETYNQMVEQLQDSAQKLAQSEREGGWREMARQVAHEIKNPLTPMKLGLQHLQRILKEDLPNKEETINRISRTLVEQIDTLSGIASAFGDLARLPGADMQKVNIVTILENTAALYSNDGKNNIRFLSHPAEAYIMGDKDQLLRIFGNLIKNAVQAIPENRNGLIEIGIERNDEWITVCIADNGTGIPSDQQARMFVPNFTTKSGGTGLGLAMVKAMTEGMGGKVWFETRLGEGTGFFVRFRKSA